MSYSKLCRLILPALAVFAFFGVPNESQGSINVGTKLSLVIDISGSIDTSEYNLMMDGYAEAFNNAAVRGNILSQTNGIAVNIVFFSSEAVSNGWFHLDSNAAIDTFRDYLAGLARPDSGVVGTQTDIAAGMVLGLSALADIEFLSNRLIMDVSGDGEQNQGSHDLVNAQRDLAAIAGINVNGLAIGGPSLLAYYDARVKTSGGFAIQANNFALFKAAVLRKIRRETQEPLPEPTTIMIWGGLGLIAFGYCKRVATD